MTRFRDKGDLAKITTGRLKELRRNALYLLADSSVKGYRRELLTEQFNAIASELNEREHTTRYKAI